MKNQQFDSLVWGSLTLAPITLKGSTSYILYINGGGFPSVSNHQKRHVRNLPLHINGPYSNGLSTTDTEK